MNDKTAEQLNSVVAQLQTELNRHDRLAAASLQVGSAEDLQVIRMLLAAGPLRVGEIAARRSSSVATVSARLDRLERRGIVFRDRHPDDRRAVIAKLTSAGVDTAEASRKARVDSIKKLEGQVQIEQLAALVEALAENAELPSVAT